MDSNNKIWIMMGRSLSGEISADEQSELNDLLKSDPYLYQQFSMLKQLWNKSLAEEDVLDEENKERFLFKKIINKAEIERQHAVELTETKSTSIFKKLFSKRLVLAYAASIILVALFFLNRPSPLVASKPEQIIAAQYGSRSKVLLPDGTTVWLNGGSKLYYDFEFSGATREVRLDGEAFFDVVKQKGRPFIVHAGKIDIKVHGTAFNVKCYADDKNIETTLLHGKIEVTDKTNKTRPSVFLVPNQKLIVPVRTAQSNVSAESKRAYELINLDTKLQEKERIETAWIYNRVEFRAERFEDLAKKLERWYNVSIEFEDDSVQALTFNGSFEKETADQAFNALKKVAAFDFEIQGREIRIKSYEKNASGVK
jgi:transmembrane sensor